jgi:hypothetical protein
MLKKLMFILLLSFIFGQQNKEISLRINDSNKSSWWSDRNNNGIKEDKSYFTYYYGKKFNSFNLTLTSYFKDHKIVFGESFIKFDLGKNNRFKLGRYYRDYSLYLNDNISSGSMLISKNALPMPKIGLTGEFIPKQNNKLKFDYGISHAIFDSNSTYSKSPYLHEKFIYLTRKGKIDFGVGLVHEAIWAGESFRDGDFPDTFSDFLKIFISADGKYYHDDILHSNALGNHLGIWDFYLIKNNNNNSLKFYYQHLFEDTSGLRFANRADGLWGLEYIDQLKKINYLIEFLNTKNQDRDPPYVNEAYYNHTEYTLGWNYKGNVLGNPFLSSLNPNPLQVLHLGVQSLENKNIQFKILLSRRIDAHDSFKYSINIGKNYFNKTLISLFINGVKNKNIGLRLSYSL